MIFPNVMLCHVGSLMRQYKECSEIILDNTESVDMPSGGKRLGAGKKPGMHGTKTGTTLKLSDDVREFLKSHESASGYVEDSIRKSAAFKKWLANRGMK